MLLFKVKVILHLTFDTILRDVSNPSTDSGLCYTRHDLCSKFSLPCPWPQLTHQLYNLHTVERENSVWEKTMSLSAILFWSFKDVCLKSYL